MSDLVNRVPPLIYAIKNENVQMFDFFFSLIPCDANVCDLEGKSALYISFIINFQSDI